MFNENLKALRKNKGFTQEELAQKVNVVRQTVSKWEKGLSVPDADALQKIAEVLDVEISQLLGADIVHEENKNEIAEQLAKINEQLIIRNRRAGKIWKIVGFSILGIVIFSILINIIAFILFGAVKSESSGTSVVTEKEYMEEDIK